MGSWVSGRRKGGIALGLALLAFAIAAPAHAAPAVGGETRYSLANGCFAIYSPAAGAYVTRDGGGYRASAANQGGAERFRMKATALGRYLFYEASERFMAVGPGGVSSAGGPSDAADLTVRALERGVFTITNGSNGRRASVAEDGRLVSVPGDSAGASERFVFERANGCATYPEAEVNASGKPFTGSPRFGEVRGMLEGHMHQMAFEFLGGEAHCGKPWHRFGAPYALVDCPDHELANGCAAVLENVLYGDPARCHDHVGWPTFNDWPHHRSLTHEQSYHRWVERAWRGGLRLYVNLMVENRVLCELYPFKRNSCNEMDSVLLQIEQIQEMQDYIDAQYGGPGEGWFRIVRNPYQARRVINEGKMAVVMGMEVSEPFDCRRVLRAARCSANEIDQWLDRLRSLGIRQLEITNKFDNGLTGVAGDAGETGVVTNSGNFLSTGNFWDYEHCPDAENSDRTPTGVEVPHNHDLIIGFGLQNLLPPLGGVAPIYPAAPHCNRLGLTPLGHHAVQGIIDRKMIFDPDHQSVKGRNQALDLLEQEEYSGVISSHSWSTPNATPRILGLGGVMSPSTAAPLSFASKWRRARDAAHPDHYFGIGFGADQNGFATQPGPRGGENPVSYPFTSFDGGTTFERQVSGERVFDINTDGVAHYGLHPDWIEDLRIVVGEGIVEDLGRGAEAYLQMWERADGIPAVSCGGWGRRSFTRHGVGPLVRLGMGSREALATAGQPADRTRTWRWCAGGDRDETERRIVAGFRGGSIALVASTLSQHSAGGVRPGHSRQRVPDRASRLDGNLWVANAGAGRTFVYQLRGGRVHQVGVAAANLGSRAGFLRRHLDAY